MKNLPTIAPEYLAACIEAAPSRLRKKLDKNPQQAKEWDWKQDNERLISITINEETIVSLQSDHNRIQSHKHASCNCLLAPKCYHLLAVLSYLPIDENIYLADTKDNEIENKVEDKLLLNEKQKKCVEENLNLLSKLLDNGISSAGAIIQSNLLRCIHSSKCEGLYLLANHGLNTLNLIRSYHAKDHHFKLSELLRSFSLYAKTTITLSKPNQTFTPDHIGTARQKYNPCGNLKLKGNLCEAIITRRGQIGVSSHFIDDTGKYFSLSNIKPKLLHDLMTAYKSGIEIGDINLSHFEVVRKNLIIHNASASAHNQLSKGKNVKAVISKKEEKQSDDHLFKIPFTDQVNKVMLGETDFLFLNLKIVGKKQSHLVVQESSSNKYLIMKAQSELHETCLHNLSILSKYSELSFRAICRISKSEIAVIYPLSIEEHPLQSEVFHFPDKWSNKCMLSLDKLEGNYFKFPKKNSEVNIGPLDDIKIFDLYVSILKKIILSGRQAVIRTSSKAFHLDIKQLNDHQLKYGAKYYINLIETCRKAEFDTSGLRNYNNHLDLTKVWSATHEYAKIGNSTLISNLWLDYIKN